MTVKYHRMAQCGVPEHDDYAGNQKCLPACLQDQRASRIDQSSTQPNSSSDTKSPLSEALSAISSRLRFILVWSGSIGSRRLVSVDKTFLTSQSPY